ncbi:MAG: glycosyltransferase family 4 protein [Leuconostoc mesenteroides]
MKILCVATYGDFLATFELSNIELWTELGCEVHCVADFESAGYNRNTAKLDKLHVIKHQIKFSRSPIDKSNLVSYRNLRLLMKKERFDVLDCHNAVIGVFARIAAHFCRIPYVIYTAHGFIFYRGGSVLKSMVFKPIEAFLAKWTNLLITINEEDFAQSRRFHVNGKSLYVPGIGIDTEKISKISENGVSIRRELGISNSAIIYLNVGELIPRKNQEALIRAFSMIKNTDSYLLICGIGAERDKYLSLIEELHLSDRVKLLGYRSDVPEIMHAVDCFVFPSIQEGLPVSLMEAMASGLPCIVSNIRGNSDLIQQGKGGWLVDPNNLNELSTSMERLASADRLRMQQINLQNIKEFDIQNVRHIMKNEYSRILATLKMN